MLTQPQVTTPIFSKSVTWYKVATHCKGFVAHFFDNEEWVFAIWFYWLLCLYWQIHMTDVQLNYINDGNKYFHLHKPSHSTKQQLISAKTLYILTLLDSGFSETQICDQTGFSDATISYVHSQHTLTLPMMLVMIFSSLLWQILIMLNTLFAWGRLITLQKQSKHFRILSTSSSLPKLYVISSMLEAQGL